ncbi:MAG: DUF1801 domain-containing protein [Ignavibacteriales bacterium]|nr:DUF1801 domain-containing protein [Ignavibacteriales bacterium]
MGAIKTKATKLSIGDFLKSIEPEKKRTDSIALKKVFDSAVQEKPALWNNNMIGYGSFHYKSERSTQEGDWPLTGFSPRAQNMTVYIMPGAKKYPELLKNLGKFKISGGSCIYINNLDDVDLNVLKKLIAASVKDMKKKYG